MIETIETIAFVPCFIVVFCSRINSRDKQMTLSQCQLFMPGNRTHGALGSFAAFAEPDLKNLLEQEIHLRTLRNETVTVR